MEVSGPAWSQRPRRAIADLRRNYPEPTSPSDEMRRSMVAAAAILPSWTREEEGARASLSAVSTVPIHARTLRKRRYARCS